MKEGEGLAKEYIHITPRHRQQCGDGQRGNGDICNSVKNENTGKKLKNMSRKKKTEETKRYVLKLLHHQDSTDCIGTHILCLPIKKDNLPHFYFQFTYLLLN